MSYANEKEKHLETTTKLLDKRREQLTDLQNTLKLVQSQKADTEEQLKTKAAAEQELQKQIDDLNAQLQAKIERQKAAKIQLASYVTPVAQAAPAYTGGSGCDWLRGQLAASGVSLSDIDAAMYIAGKESGCSPSAVNRSSGACNVFQEYPCGKWGGSTNVVAHIQGASAYAANRYGGWWGAYNFWVANHWW